MELDDLKQPWKEFHHQADHNEGPSKEVSQIIGRSRNSLRKIFRIELLIGLTVCLAFLIVAATGIVFPFLYKMVAITLIVPIPIYYRLYQSIRFMERLDYGKDLKTTLTEFIAYYRTTIRIYKWGSYLMIFLIFIVFLTDSSFQQLNRWYQSATILYLGLVTLIVNPFVNRVYGSKLKSFELLLKDQ